MWFAEIFVYLLYVIIMILVCFLVIGVIPYALSLIREELEIFKKRVVYEVSHGHHRLGMPNANTIAQELVMLRKTGQLAIARSEWVL
jgi:hypothetical protein